MLSVLKNTWALMLGLALLMLGNGMQGTLLGIRGGIEAFSSLQMSIVMSAYFLGFLFGSRIVPNLIQRVGHVRVFAALGSLISAIIILYAAAPDWVAWTVLRMLIGFCFSGVYIAAESWLNNSTTNETRGQTLSLYMMVQMVGIISAQALLNIGDPAGFTLFIIPSVLVSIAFTPILLSVAPTPAFATIKPMSIKELYRASPLGCVGIFLVGGVYSTLLGMSSVWGAEVGLSVADVTIFVSFIYIGGLLFQYPIGWLSDRKDRRKIVLWLSIIGAVVLVQPMFFELSFWIFVMIGATIGAIVNPVYSLLLAYVNDYMDNSDMASASAGLMFINGLGAISGPLITGWMMAFFGPSGFFLFNAILFVTLAFYAAWRMTQRIGTTVPSSSYTAITPAASVITVEAAFHASEDGQTQP